MDELTMGNILTIGAGVIATLTAFLKLQYDQRSEAKAVEVQFKTMDRYYSKEVESINDGIELVHTRITKTNERIDDEKKENQAEFKEINGKLNKILGILEAKD